MISQHLSNDLTTAQLEAIRGGLFARGGKELLEWCDREVHRCERMVLLGIAASFDAHKAAMTEALRFRSIIRAICGITEE